MKELIESLITTLNTIEVKGEQNLDRMLGCILTLKQISEALEGGDGNANDKAE